MKKIIIVDDDPAIQEAFRLIFPSEKYDIELHPNARALLPPAEPVADLFIFDKQLPGVDGLDLCRLLKQQASTRHIPTLMLSASPNIVRMAQEAGADEVLEKPFSLSQLRQAVRRLTGD